MPRWEERPGSGEMVEHVLDGARAAAAVYVDHATKRTVISLALLVDGTDPATVDRCKVRAEQLLADVQRGAAR